MGKARLLGVIDSASPSRKILALNPPLPAICIPVYRPELGNKEKAYVLQCLESTWISSKGEFIGRFQSDFARFIGAEHAVAVTNGTVALHLALLGVGLGPGDEVIVPSLTYIAAVNSIRYVGATPVFADVDAHSWQINPVHVARLITPRTRAILAVHTYGQACDLSALRLLCEKHHLRLIEDCAEAFGTRIGERHVGTFGDVATFSFFGNKTVTTGEGGMVVSRDPKVHALICKLRGQGLAGEKEYWHDIVGYNYRMTNICAAIGVAQMERADELIHRKRALATAMREAMAGLPLDFHLEQPGTTHSFWMISALARSEDERDKLRHALRSEGIETRPVFPPVHTMPMYATGQVGLDVSVNLAARGFNLPSWPGLKPDQVAQIAAAARRFYRA
jgi:perosamine synthetase